MAMGTRRKQQRQQDLFYAAELVEAPRHPFYSELNEALEAPTREVSGPRRPMPPLGSSPIRPRLESLLVPPFSGKRPFRHVLLGFSTLVWWAARVSSRAAFVRNAGDWRY
jgi:hypothetical protein